MNNKHYIPEKYSHTILQLAHKYLNENPQDRGETCLRMEKTLETMDIYRAYINGMGFMMYGYSIQALGRYIAGLKPTEHKDICSRQEIKEVARCLEGYELG